MKTIQRIDLQQKGLPERSGPHLSLRRPPRSLRCYSTSRLADVRASVRRCRRRNRSRESRSSSAGGGTGGGAFRLHPFGATGSSPGISTCPQCRSSAAENALLQQLGNSAGSRMDRDSKPYPAARHGDGAHVPAVPAARPIPAHACCNRPVESDFCWPRRRRHAAALHRGTGRHHSRSATGQSTPTIFLDIRTRIAAGGERGLLGLAFHPQYATQRPVLRLLHARRRRRDRHRRIPRVRQSERRRRDAETVLLTIPHPTHANHNGGMLAFGPDGYPLHRRRRRRLGQRSAEQRAEHRRAARQDPAHRRRSAGPRRHALFLAARQSVRRRARAATRSSAIGLRNPWRFSFDRADRRSCGWPTSARARARKSTRRS